MPHERSSKPVLPFEFSSIALADRKIRFRRESPAARPPSTAAPPDPGKTADSKELDSKHPPASIAALICGCLRDRHDNGRGDASLGLDEIAWVFRPTGQQADEWFAMLADEGEAGRLDALRMITEEAADDPRCRVVLSDRLARDPSPRVREDAAGALASRGREATVRRALQDAADQDEDLQVRSAARYAIRLAAST